MLARTGLYWPQLLWPSLGREQRALWAWPGAQDRGQEWGVCREGGAPHGWKPAPVSAAPRHGPTLLEAGAPEGPPSRAEGLTSLWSRERPKGNSRCQGPDLQ